MTGNDTSDSKNIIALHPDFKKLKDEVGKLRAELAMLVLEQDSLLCVECKNIEMLYMLSIGGLEYKAYEIECAVLRLKRKTELMRVRKNRQEKIIVSVIEDILDAEFAEYQARLNEQLNKMNAAIERSRNRPLTDEESRELKKLYRSIVKALHPDLHPDLSDEKIQLFNNALESYKNGDLNGLRVIDAMVANSMIPDAKSDGLMFLTKEKERLTKLLQSIKDRISDIKSKYPYTMKSLVRNPEKIEARKSEIGYKIKQLNEVLAAYTARIAEMLR